MNGSDTASTPPDRVTVAFCSALAALLPAPRPRGPWIAALSGGCDSTALCALLHAAAEGGGPAPPQAEIHALHVNHGLRGPDADDDEEAARETAQHLGFPFRSVRLAPSADLPVGAIEKWARSERYRVLHEAAAAIGASVVLTGHNRDDQAETVLLRVMHGAGVWGLAGIRPVRPLRWGSRILLLRPLLPFTRAALAAYLERVELTFRHDGSNDALLFERNRVRHRVLPALSAGGGGAGGDPVENLVAIAETAAQVHAQIDRYAERTVIFETNRSLIPRAAFEAAPELIRFGLVRAAAHAVKPSQVPLSSGAFSDVVRALGARGVRTGRGGRSFELGGGVRLREDADRLVVELVPEEEPLPRYDEIPLSVPGRTRLPDGSLIEAILEEAPGAVPEKAPGEAPGEAFANALEEADCEFLDADRAGPELTVRLRRPGDTFHPLGSPGRKKLKSFLIDRKIPAADRERLPLVCRGDEILWVVGVRIAESARVTGKTRRLLALTRVLPAPRK